MEQHTTCSTLIHVTAADVLGRIPPVHDFKHLSSKLFERVIEDSYFGVLCSKSRVRVAHYVQRRVPLQVGHCNKVQEW